MCVCVHEKNKRVFIFLVILVDDLISGTKQKYFSHKKKANDQQTNKQIQHPLSSSSVIIITGVIY